MQQMPWSPSTSAPPSARARTPSRQTLQCRHSTLIPSLSIFLSLSRCRARSLTHTLSLSAPAKSAAAPTEHELASEGVLDDRRRQPDAAAALAGGVHAARRQLADVLEQLALGDSGVSH
eukprot:1078394-Rhodomonas_salina.1